MKILYEEYLIEVDSYNFTLYKTNNNTPIGHYSRLVGAIKKIAHLNMAEKKETVTLKEYIERYEARVDELTKYIKIDSK